MEKYEFVFHVVGPKTLPRVGPKIARVLDSALDSLGSGGGWILLAPHMLAINAATQPDYYLLRKDRRITEDGANFSLEEGLGGLTSISIKFEAPAALVARFERACWWTPVLDIGVRSSLRVAVHDNVTKALQHMYRTEPGLGARRFETPSGLRPRARGMRGY